MIVKTRATFPYRRSQRELIPKLKADKLHRFAKLSYVAFVFDYKRSALSVSMILHDLSYSVSQRCFDRGHLRRTKWSIVLMELRTLHASLTCSAFSSAADFFSTHTPSTVRSFFFVASKSFASTIDSRSPRDLDARFAPFPTGSMTACDQGRWTGSCVI